MKVTKRDLRLLKLLSSYGFLSTTQIEKFVFNSIATTTVLRRLRILEKTRFIKRIIGLESHELLWMLTAEGARLAKVEIPKSKWSKNMLDHDHKLVTLRIALEVAGLVRSWTPEHEIRSFIFRKHGLRGIKDRIVPDAFMAIETSGYQASVAIELELNLKNQAKLRKTLRSYIEKGKFHALWYVAPKTSILESVWRQWHAVGGDRSSIKLYVSLLSEVMQDPLKARLMGPKPHSLIGEIWKIQGAQGVSTQEKVVENNSDNSTEGNHAPNIDLAS